MACYVIHLVVTDMMEWVLYVGRGATPSVSPGWSTQALFVSVISMSQARTIVLARGTTFAGSLLREDARLVLTQTATGSHLSTTDALVGYRHALSLRTATGEAQEFLWGAHLDWSTMLVFAIHHVTKNTPVLVQFAGRIVQIHLQ